MTGPSPGIDDDAELRSDLLRLERALAERDASTVPDGLAALLDDDFIEFGSSGRIWDRRATIDELLSVAPSGPLEITTFTIRRLDRDTVLATYETDALRADDAGRRRSLRSSVWVRRHDRWRIAFHQGTPLPPEQTP